MLYSWRRSSLDVCDVRAKSSSLLLDRKLLIVLTCRASLMVGVDSRANTWSLDVVGHMLIVLTLGLSICVVTG